MDQMVKASMTLTMSSSLAYVLIRSRLSFIDILARLTDGAACVVNTLRVVCRCAFNHARNTGDFSGHTSILV